MKVFWSKVIAFYSRLTSTVKILLIVALIVLLGMGACRVIRGSVSSRIAKVENQLIIARHDATVAQNKFDVAEAARVKAVEDAKVDTILANTKLAKLALANQTINKDLAAEKAKTAALTSDALASSLGTYIGANNVYASVASPPTFVLTRMGAENSRDLFLAGDAACKKLLNCESSREQDAVKLSACSTELGSTNGALEACKAARLSDADVIKLLQKDLTLQKAKARWTWVKAGLPAVAVGVVIGFLVHK